MFEYKKVHIGNLHLVPESVVSETLPPFGDSIKCICISPIVLAEPAVSNLTYKKFISPDLDLFSDLLYDSTMSRMEKSGAYTTQQMDSYFKFQILPDKDYLNKLKQGEKKFARIYPVNQHELKHEIRGYIFPFTLFAAPQVQSFLFDCGLGAFTSQGFGMLDMANADLHRKTATYQLDTAIKPN